MHQDLDSPNLKPKTPYWLKTNLKTLFFSPLKGET